MHFAICLQPSRVPISGLELAILIFQLGRLLMEIKQIADTTQQPSEKKKLKHKALLDHFRYITFYCVYLLSIPFWPQIKSLTTNANHGSKVKSAYEPGGPSGRRLTPVSVA